MLTPLVMPMLRKYAARSEGTRTSGSGADDLGFGADCIRFSWPVCLEPNYMSATYLPLSLNKICLWETLRLLSSTPTPASSVSANTCNMCVSDLAFFIFNHHSSIVGILLLDIHHTPARTRRQIRDSIMLALTMTFMTECVWECADARASTQAGLRACMPYMHGTIGQDTPAGRGRIL